MVSYLQDFQPKFYTYYLNVVCTVHVPSIPNPSFDNTTGICEKYKLWNHFRILLLLWLSQVTVLHSATYS
jgi:hypothetical protein